MASTKVRGITIELGADTSGLSKALKNVNTEIGKTQKDLKDVERLLKLDPTNTELLAQKQKLLTDRVEETKTKLDALKQAQASIDMSTEEGQRQYDALTREIVSCENELKQAEQAASGFNATAARISTTAGNLSKKFGSLADKTKGLSLAATGALTGLAGLAVKAGKDADELLTLSKQTGIATSELQKMQYASELIDVDTDTIVGGLKKLKKGLESNKDTFKKLGIQVQTWNGEYRGMTDIFYDTVLALSKIPNETERDIVAMKLFGKSADELAGVIDDGGAALKALGQEAENLGVIIPEEDLDRAAELDDELERLKADILPMITKLGIELIEAIQPHLPEIKEAIGKISSAMKDISPEMVAIVGGILTATAVLSPLLSVLSGVFSIVSSIVKIAPQIGTALSSVSSFLTADIGATLAAGGASAGAMFAASLVASIVAALAGAELGKKMGEYIFPDDAELYQQYQGIEGTFDMIKDLGIALKDFFVMTWEDAVKTEEKNIEIISRGWDIFCTAMTAAWDNAWNVMKDTFSSIWSSIKAAFIDVINGFISGLNKVSGGISKMTNGSVNLGQIAYMAEGGVLTSGTAVVGEAGPEIVHISDGKAMVQPLGSGDELTSLLETYLPYLAAGTQLVMDSGALVGSIAPDMNTALGTIAIRGGRR